MLWQSREATGQQEAALTVAAARGDVASRPCVVPPALERRNGCGGAKGWGAADSLTGHPLKGPWREWTCRTPGVRNIKPVRARKVSSAYENSRQNLKMGRSGM